MGSKEIVSNRKATYNYDIQETLEAGIVLTGTEIKSLRDHGGNIQDAYVIFKQGEAWLMGAMIAHYRFGNINNHEEVRPRKLLLHRYELHMLSKRLQTKGIAIIPLALLLRNGLVKVRLGCGKGKKQHDKRQSIIAREQNREVAKTIKEMRSRY